MPAVKKISIALTPEMVAVVRDAVNTGEYASSSEVVRDALREWTEKRRIQREEMAALRRAWREARSDKSPGLPIELALDRLERKYQALANASKR